MHNFREYVNPYLGRLFENIKLDKDFIRGDGCWLYDSDGNTYLDCVGAYGALPFGHHPAGIWNSVLDFQFSKEPNFIQPSCLNAAGELAKKLVELSPEGLRYVTFANSGTEAVEAAVKLCRSATGRPGILSTRNSFHGKTLGALSATGKASYQKVFGAPVEGFHFVEYGNIQSLEWELKNKPDYYAAFMIEPIQGEGGIIEPPPGYLAMAKSICCRYGVKLILDEIQTGLGRTGTLFASEYEGVCPDVLLLAKALGGGIMPIGACLCTKEVYNEDFATKHSSTFAGNSLSCRIGLKVLELLEGPGNAILENVRNNGEFLKSKLAALKEIYPQLIGSIRGKGLMLGIEFNIGSRTFPNSMLGILAEKALLTPVISSYLLNVEKLRVAPTLNGSHVIRIEPPLTITREECSQAVERIGNMLYSLSKGNTAGFLSFLVRNKPINDFPSLSGNSAEIPTPSGNKREGKFAFIVHPLDYRSLEQFDASFAALNDHELEHFKDIWNEIAGPFVLSRMKVTSDMGSCAYGEFICVLRTAEELMQMPRKEALNEIRCAIRLAKDRGAEIIGLGAYTSVVSMAGLYLKDCGIPLTTGNSYTVVSAVEAVNYAIKKAGMPSSDLTAAIVGAAGSIGKGLSLLLSESVSRLILIGNPSGSGAGLERLYRLAAEIYRYLSEKLRKGIKFLPKSMGDTLSVLPGLPDADAPLDAFVRFATNLDIPTAPVVVSTEMHRVLPLADIVLCATNSTEKIITPETLKFRAIVCDISRPANVSAEIYLQRPDIIVIDGGVVQIPGLPSLGMNFGFEDGLCYACMAETMLLALEQHYHPTSLGSSGVNLESVLFTKTLSEKHGFKLALPRSFNKPLDNERWLRYAAFRNS